MNTAELCQCLLPLNLTIYCIISNHNLLFLIIKYFFTLVNAQQELRNYVPIHKEDITLK